MHYQSPTPQVESVTPANLRVIEAVRYSGFSRSTVYRLIKDGAIKAYSVRRRGAARGMRLISKESLDQLIMSGAAV